ncbi:cold-shock protein [Paenibacillus daejeonensis]|uniref:cold-shock protein n=1 Tax=Paenibacillus daejeonensis TaxID=135193 RepID=UPI000A01E2DF|nr:cold-shock protein [Paenibacillus daejeonensis]
MYYSKKSAEPTPEEQTSIWSCLSDGCECWMRDNFSFDSNPNCPICGSEMLADSRMLPVLKK